MLTYNFQVDNASQQLLQSGPGNVSIPRAACVGPPIVCIVQASNPGGVSTLRSGTTPPLAPDTAPPSASIARREVPSAVMHAVDQAPSTPTPWR